MKTHNITAKLFAVAQRTGGTLISIADALTDFAHEAHAAALQQERQRTALLKHEAEAAIQHHGLDHIGKVQDIKAAYEALLIRAHATLQQDLASAHSDFELKRQELANKAGEAALAYADAKAAHEEHTL